MAEIRPGPRCLGGLSNVTIPVLVLAGDHDRVEPPAVLAEHLLPLIPHTTMTVLEDTGHLPPVRIELFRQASKGGRKPLLAAEIHHCRSPQISVTVGNTWARRTDQHGYSSIDHSWHRLGPRIDDPAQSMGPSAAAIRVVDALGGRGHAEP